MYMREQQSGLQLQLHVSPPGLVIVSDRRLWQHVLANMVDNAVKYSLTHSDGQSKEGERGGMPVQEGTQSGAQSQSQGEHSGHGQRVQGGAAQGQRVVVRITAKAAARGGSAPEGAEVAARSAHAGSRAPSGG